MKLSELCQRNQTMTVQRDADFDMLGMVTTQFHHEQVLTFLESEKYLPGLIGNPNVTAIICTPAIFESGQIPEQFGVVTSEQPRLDFYRSHNELASCEFYWQAFENDIHPTAEIHPSAVLYDHSIRIGKTCIIEANVVIHPGTIIGDYCIIRSGSQIGTQGFQFLNTGTEIVSVKAAGRVVMEDHVEIQHLTCVDRGMFGGDTLIKRYAKIDNQCQIAHDAYIGERALIVSGTQFGGRVTLGEDAWCGINSTISNGIRLGDRSRASLGAVVTKDVPSDTTVSGNFAIEHQIFIEKVKREAKK